MFFNDIESEFRTVRRASASETRQLSASCCAVRTGPLAASRRSGVVRWL